MATHEPGTGAHQWPWTWKVGLCSACRERPPLATVAICYTNLYTEVAEKVDTWLAHRTRMVIVIDPRRRIVAVHRSPTTVRHLTIDDTLDGEQVVPGWTVLVRELFTRVAG